MFYNTPNGFHVETDNGWTVSLSLTGHEAWEKCELAVWPTGLDDQDNWVRWGANGTEPPDFPIFDRVLKVNSTTEMLRVIERLSSIEVGPNKWVSKGLVMESKWR